MGRRHYVGEGQELTLDVRQLLDSAIRMADSEIRHRALVVRDYEDVPSVCASDSRLGQVFLNLVVNAAQAIPEGGRERNEIRLTTRVEGDAVIVEVSDTGIGIAPTLIDRVFDPFVTSKAKGIGTGLGLYISRNIVTSLGGELTVTSTVGRGTCFRIRLPVGPGPAKPEPEVSVETDVTQGWTRTRILVVDDEAVILKVMQAFLRAHDVTVARSGREAIQVLASTEFDLVFCDLMMPDLGGIDVYEHLLTHSPGRERQIVFMTGGAFTERAANFLRTVPNEILDKPFSGRDIQALVARRLTAE